MATKRILVLEDNPDLLRLYCKVLRRAGYEVDEAATVAAADSLLDAQQYNLFLSDIRIGGESGSTLLQRRIGPLQAANTRVVVVSAEAHYRSLSDEMGADFFLTKPISMETLLTLIKRLTMMDGSAL